MENILSVLLPVFAIMARLIAVLVIIYSANVLRRYQLPGSLSLFTGILAAATGEMAQVMSFTGSASPIFWAFSLPVASIGYCFVAYGIGRLAYAVAKASGNIV
jgi:hypothetical protein